MTKAKQREIWVDNVKVIACFLVVVGHFFQSMTKANILPENDLYQWFIQTIYYFHVQLFFICSGYFQMICNAVGMADKYKAKAADFICEKYNWDDVVKQTLALYQK